MEKHPGAEVIRIKLATQVSFLNRATLSRALNEVPRGGHILIDARSTDFIDPDVVSLIREFKEQTAPARDIEVSLRGFRNTYGFEDQTQYVAHSSRDIQSTLTPQQVLDLMKEKHERFRTGQRISRDLTSQVIATTSGQHPWPSWSVASTPGLPPSCSSTWAWATCSASGSRGTSQAER